MYVLNLFDPWKGKLCTCPVKYSLSPYTGCSHSCLYCYITSYIPKGFEPRPKKDFIHKLRLDLKRADRSLCVSMANSSDPYQPLEEKMGLTREALRLLVENGFKVLIITKSSLVLRDLDVLRAGGCAVSVTVTSLNEELTKVLEPSSPPPAERISALKRLASNGIPCSARVDPVIPGLNDDLSELDGLLGELSGAGVKHVVCSTYKARPDSLLRLIEAFPSLRGRLKELYLKLGEPVGNARYLPEGLRRRLLSRLKAMAEARGLTFSVCREGFKELNSGGSCDGSHLISFNKFKYKEAELLTAL